MILLHIDIKIIYYLHEELIVKKAMLLSYFLLEIRMFMVIASIIIQIFGAVNFDCYSYFEQSAKSILYHLLQKQTTYCH